MKKILYGTTALATAALFAGGAHAATAPSLKVSGYYNTAILFGDDGNSDDTSVTFENYDAKIFFQAEGTADNGLTYGARITLRGTSYQNDRIEDTYAYFQGAFGRVEFGTRKGVGSTMTYQGPTPDAAGFLLVDSPYYWPGGSSWLDSDNGGLDGVGIPTITTYSNLSGRATKINYYTPRIEGFQLGLTYTPHGCSSGPGLGGSNLGSGDSKCNWSGGFENKHDGKAGQDFEVALNFNREFSGVTVGASATYAYQEAPKVSGAKDRQAAGAGINAAFGAYEGTITVGGSFLYIDKGYNYYAFQKGAKDFNYEAGVQYATGPWSFGVEGVYGATYAKGDTDIQTFGLGVGGGYQLAEGLTLSAGFLHYSYDVDGARNGDYAPSDANVFLIGTGITF